jgi:hypothetical protein
MSAASCSAPPSLEWVHDIFLPARSGDPAFLRLIAELAVAAGVLALVLLFGLLDPM